MRYRAVVKQSGAWWIGWLVDLPGVNAQEKTRAKVMESLRVGAALEMIPIAQGMEKLV